jgi:hypothetical protein
MLSEEKSFTVLRLGKSKKLGHECRIQVCTLARKLLNSTTDSCLFRSMLERLKNDPQDIRERN